MQAATKQYVDTHAANLPVNSIPYQGTSGSMPVAATPANIASLYRSTVWGPGQATQVGTTFHEGPSGAALAGTSPATGMGSLWAAWPSVSGGSYAAGGGVSLPISRGNDINAGANDYTATWSGITNTPSVYYVVRFGGTVSSGYLAVETLGAGGVSLLEINSGAATTVGNSAVASGASGSIAVTVAGNSVTVTPFGGRQITYTIPAGHQALTGQYVGFFNVGSSTQTIGGLNVTAAGTVPLAVACSGFMNQDGTCSAPSSNNMAAADSSGHFVGLPEKGTRSVNGVASIAWQDDFGAGVYDPRDPRWGPQDTQAHQAAALQNMSNQMACDLAMGKVQNARAQLPQGAYAVDKLLMAPGSTWEGLASSSGGTRFYTFVNNHFAAEFPFSMTVTCSDGQSHTDSLSNSHVSHITFSGCAQGGCSNAAGDTANYGAGGPYNSGFEMQSTAGVVEYVSASAFGGTGLRVNGMDSKTFHVTVQSSLEWYYYGGYKGITETAAGPESTGATIAGSTGSVVLSWTAVPSAAGYVLYRGTSAGAENIFYILGNVTSFTDTCATGASGSINNVVTNSLATPGAVTATASETGGTCAAGTYYYKIRATTGDGWHGSAEFTGVDTMVDWAEVYGLFDAPTAYTAFHLADISAGGGYSHYDHLWPQLGLVGIVQPGAQGIGDVYENFRVDFARTYGIYATAANLNFNGGIIDGSCTATNAATINTGQNRASFAGTCQQFYSVTGAANQITNTRFLDNNGFGPTYKTADMLLENTSAIGTIGSFQYINSEGLKSGAYITPQNPNFQNVTGPKPSIAGFNAISPVDASPITYTGFLNVEVGQDFYIYGGNANVTIANNSYIKTCTGANINLGSVAGVVLHFRYTGVGSAGLFGLPVAVAQVCSSSPAQPTIASSDTVTFSATPIFSTATRSSYIQLTGNVTSFTLGTGTDGQEKTLTFCQNATGGYTVTAPANVRGFMAVGTAATKCSSQHFTYSAAQAAWLADSAGVTNE
ncbi:MAG TPA: hypothetical protein VF126_17590, partial [Acidobacteriaceae bacterium]